jgi:hypothetical protein
VSEVLILEVLASEINNLAPAIFSCNIDLTLEKHLIQKIVRIRNVIMRDIQYDGLTRFFDIFAAYIDIDGLVMTNIGHKTPPAKDFIDSLDNLIYTSVYPERDLSIMVSLLKVYLFTSFWVTQSPILVKNSEFSNIDVVNGALPVFEFKRIQTLNEDNTNEIFF